MPWVPAWPGPLDTPADDWLTSAKLAGSTQTLYPLQAHGAVVPAAAAAGASSSLQDSLGDLPPLGCAPDAYKLFVGNISKQFTEEDLIPVFESVGNVVECYVVRDKASSESKGSAFVW